MGPEKILEIVLQGGPMAISLLLAVVALHLNKERLKLQKQLERMHEEKEAMFREWKEETDGQNERLHTALHNSTIAVSTNAANTDAVKVSLNAIMTFLGSGREYRK